MVTTYGKNKLKIQLQIMEKLTVRFLIQNMR